MDERKGKEFSLKLNSCCGNFEDIVVKCKSQKHPRSSTHSCSWFRAPYHHGPGCRAVAFI